MIISELENNSMIILSHLLMHLPRYLLHRLPQIATMPQRIQRMV